MFLSACIVYCSSILHNTPLKTLHRGFFAWLPLYPAVSPSATTPRRHDSHQPDLGRPSLVFSPVEHDIFGVGALDAFMGSTNRGFAVFFELGGPSILGYLLPPQAAGVWRAGLNWSAPRRFLLHVERNVARSGPWLEGITTGAEAGEL